MSLINIKDGARQLGVGITKMYELINTGDIPTVKIGASRKIRQADLDAYIASLATDVKAVRDE
jgi:excisionase family DNA binding protein